LNYFEHIDILTRFLPFRPHVARIHGFKEGWASTMVKVMPVPKIDQTKLVADVCDVFSGAAQLATSHWNRSATHQPVPWCSKMLVMPSCHRLTKFAVHLGPLYLCSKKQSSSQLTAVLDFRHLSVLQSFELFVQIWRSLSLSHPQLQFCGRTCQDSRRFCFVTLLPIVGPISDIFGRRCRSLQYLQLTIWNACLATPVTPASLRNTELHNCWN